MNKQIAQLSLSAPALLLCIQSWAGTVDPELAERVMVLPADAHVDVIIRMQGEVDPRLYKDKDVEKRTKDMVKDMKGVLEKEESKELKRELKVRDAEEVVDLWIIGGIAARVPAGEVDALANSTGVESVSLDRKAAVPASGASWLPEENLEAVGALGSITQGLWDLGYDGTGVVIATMDTGVDANHPDLGPRYRGGSNSWFDPYGEHSTPYDAASTSNGHGTHVMGLLVGGNASGTSVGVAPGAQWIAVKIFDDQGEASLSAIHQGFQWLLNPDGDPYTHDVPDVVNNSWILDGTQGICDREFETDIATLKNAGIVLVFAAGNTGPVAGSSVSPANNAEAFSVSGVYSSGTVTTESARGPSACDGGTFPTLVAPSESVTTTDHTSGLPLPFIAQVSGTSAAAPHVAGGMALLKQAFPGATVTQLESSVIETAADLGLLGADDEYGHGLLKLLAGRDWLAAHLGLLQPGEIHFSEAGYSASEDAGGVTITISRTGGSAGDVTVDYATTDDTATAGQDYQAASGTLTFLDGETSQTFTVDLLDDTDYEGDEDLSLSLTNATGGATLGSPDLAILTILEDDASGPVDLDGDGHTADLDCNDNDASVYPGAPEVKQDGVDQDCNGYDLTIHITRARYITAEDKVAIWATSDLDDLADLRVLIDLAAGGSVDRKMNWIVKQNRWQKAITNFVTKFGSQPTTVTVYGVEGADSLPVDVQ